MLSLFGNNEGEVGLSELFLGEGRELVESHVVGAELIGVVCIDLGEVLEKDSLSVFVFELGVEGDAVFGFPGLEL